MINETDHIQNPLRRWRKAQKLAVADCVEGSEFSAVAWYQWEAWPHGASSRYPRPSAMQFIRTLTGDAVTPNDFVPVVQEAAA